MADANYNGRQPNNTSYIKTFVEGTEPSLWSAEEFYLSSNIEVVTTTYIDNIYIPGNLYIGGKIINVDFMNTSNVNFLQDSINQSINQSFEPLITIINNLQKKIEDSQKQIDDLNKKLNAKLNAK